MGVPFSREQVDMMLKNMGPGGEALVVLTQSEYDRLVAEASRRTQDVPAGICGKTQCRFPCEYEHDDKCRVIRLIDEEDPDAPDGTVDYRCDMGCSGHLEVEDERTKANVQDCWRRRLAMGEAFGVEP